MNAPIFRRSSKGVPIVVGVSGGSGSGKTTLCRLLHAALGNMSVLMSCDDYYRSQDHLNEQQREAVNFDHPDVIDFPLLRKHIQDLKQLSVVAVPKYCFETHTRQTKTRPKSSAPVILVEGVLLFADETLVELCDMRIFCTASEEIRYRRRLGRDVVERGRTAESVQAQWRETVMPMHRQFVEPARDTSHLVIDSEQDFDETVQSLATQIRCAVG